ncbi:hypothetical protein [Nonomuraea sp. NPDC050643]|uniref:hypothetical protein n=1 Tax=Nonomuraea sp. NPDC050643 TaxID=3155660 RepID=UPI0033C44351
MGDDRGVDLSRRAIKAARTDLEEALALLRPEKGKGEVPPIFTQTGPVSRLTGDYEAMSGFWPAASGFQMSAGNGISAVTASYENIAGQVESVIELFKQAMTNYDGVETDSEGRSGTVQV